MRRSCPKCKHLLVEPSGNPKHKYLLVGEYPGYEEIREGLPFVGGTGEVLRSELARCGFILDDFRKTNLWLHAKDEETCNFQWHLDQMVKEFKGKTHVLLMGSDVVSALTGEKVTHLSSTKITIPEFRGVRFWVSPNPAIVFHAPIGEVRLAIERFCSDLKRSKP